MWYKQIIQFLPQKIHEKINFKVFKKEFFDSIKFTYLAAKIISTI